MPLFEPTEVEKALSISSAGKPNTLSQISDIISQAKSIFELLAQLRGMNISQAGNTIKEGLPANQQKSAGGLLAIINTLGLGDVPINAIIEKIGPYTLNQLIGQGQKFLPHGGNNEIGTGE